MLWLLDELEAITELGDLHSMELAKTNADIRKLHQEIKKNKWNVSLIDSSQGIDTEERDFGKLQVNYSTKKEIRSMQYYASSIVM